MEDRGTGMIKGKVESCCIVSDQTRQIIVGAFNAMAYASEVYVIPVDKVKAIKEGVKGGSAGATIPADLFVPAGMKVKVLVIEDE